MSSFKDRQNLLLEEMPCEVSKSWRLINRDRVCIDLRFHAIRIELDGHSRVKGAGRGVPEGALSVVAVTYDITLSHDSP